MASLTVENYVKTIALIAARDHGGDAVGTGELAQRLNVSPGTVTGMLKTLSEASLATYTPYEGARLTASGQAAGDEGDPPPPAARAVPRPDPEDVLGRGARGGRAHGARRLRAADRPDRRLPRPPGRRPARRPDPPRRRLARPRPRGPRCPSSARGSDSASSASSIRTPPSSAT